MPDLTSVAKESVKGLGAGAYLVSVLPSLILVLILFTLPAASLYPWSRPRVDENGREVADGLPAVIEAVRGLGVGGAVVITLIVLVVAVLARPFHIAAVQVLEGYWGSRSTFFAAFATERHRRRRSIALWTMERASPPRLAGMAMGDVVHWQRQINRNERAVERSADVLSAYPREQEQLLPTALGNILRRAETSAGERYGLNTMLTYPRLYPHLSERLETQMANQLRLLDTSAAFVLVLLVTGFAALPLLWRGDGWVLMPIGLLAAAAIGYRGAMWAATLQAGLLHTAYDLHRFDMLAAMHRHLPEDAQEELSENTDLSEFLVAGQYGHEETLPVLAGRRYEHPQPPVLVVQAVSATPGEGDTASDAKDVDHHDSSG